MHKTHTGWRSLQIFTNNDINPSSPQFKWTHFVTLKLLHITQEISLIYDKIDYFYNYTNTTTASKTHYLVSYLVHLLLITISREDCETDQTNESFYQCQN